MFIGEENVHGPIVSQGKEMLGSNTISQRSIVRGAHCRGLSEIIFQGFANIFPGWLSIHTQWRTHVILMGGHGPPQNILKT